MIAWSPSLQIGVPLLDEQHQALFERAARFEAAVLSASASSRLEEHFAFFAGYARSHFEDEERLMAQLGYPGLEEQRREHAEFGRRMELLQPLVEVEGGSTAVLTVLLATIREWLPEHVGGRDRAFGDFVRARGAG